MSLATYRLRAELALPGKRGEFRHIAAIRVHRVVRQALFDPQIVQETYESAIPMPRSRSSRISNFSLP